MRPWGALLFALVGCFPVHHGDVDPPDARVSRADGSVTDAEERFDAPTDARIDARADAAIDAPDAPPPCIPRSCSEQGASCGTGLDNGCGVPLTCGMCEATATCAGQGAANVCAVPLAARECANGWCWETPVPFAFTPTAVFARTTTDVWIIGTRGIIKHFDGTSWTAFSSNTVADLEAIYMPSATDGWIVGEAGTLLRWNGTAWNSVASGTTADLHAVHGNAANNVWIGGDRITRRWNGSSWSTVGSTTIFLGHLFVTSNNKVFGSYAGIIYENVSGAWTSRTSDTTGSLSYPYISGFAGSGTSVYAAGAVSVIAGTDYEWLWHWDGTTWTRISIPNRDPEFSDVFADGTAVWAVYGTELWNLQTLTPSPGPQGVSMSVAAGTGGELFVPNSKGLPYHLQGGTWTTPPHSSVNVAGLSLLTAGRVGDSMWFGRYAGVVEWDDGLVTHSRPNYIDAIAGTGRDNVYALDRDSFSQLSKLDHFDGQHWTAIPGPGADANDLRVTATEVHVFGEGIFRLAGTSWVPETVPETALWIAAASAGDDIFVCGTDFATSPYTPHVVKRVGGTWGALPAPPAMQSVRAIAATSPSDVWVVGQDRDPMTFVYSATLAHWNGATWTATKPVGATDATAVVATAAGEVWVATDTGALLHRTPGGVWSTMNGAASGIIRGLALDASGVLWAAGDDGAIFHR
jgi:hypothetical protein